MCPADSYCPGGDIGTKPPVITCPPGTGTFGDAGQADASACKPVDPCTPPNTCCQDGAVYPGWPASTACPTSGVDPPLICVNMGTDESNCGACGNVCPLGTTCKNGVCVVPPGEWVDGNVVRGPRALGVWGDEGGTRRGAATQRAARRSGAAATPGSKPPGSGRSDAAAAPALTSCPLPAPSNPQKIKPCPADSYCIGGPVPDKPQPTACPPGTTTAGDTGATNVLACVVKDPCVPTNGFTCCQGNGAYPP
jgi:hypothetical protein